MSEVHVQVEIKWKKDVWLIDVGNPSEMIIEELKHEIFSLSEVLPERQKLLYKGKTMKNEDVVSIYFAKEYEAYELEKKKAESASGSVPSNVEFGSKPEDNKAETEGNQTTPDPSPCRHDSKKMKLGSEQEGGGSGSLSENATMAAPFVGSSSSSADPVSSNQSVRQKSTITYLKWPTIMMLGSREADLAFILDPPDVEVKDDFEEGEEEDKPFTISDNDQLKIKKRIESAGEYIEVVNVPRPGKKLLMLDIDYTFFDHRTPAERPEQLLRPYLHELLTNIYPYYDIGIWSATSKKWIDVKLKELGVISNPNYKISIILDARAMISTYAPKYGGVVRVKPLAVLWGHAQAMGVHYDESNTIMFDDLRRNFLMNPQQGLRIRAFRKALTDGLGDNELQKLEIYLMAIKDMPSFATLNHRKWEKYCKNVSDSWKYIAH